MAAPNFENRTLYHGDNLDFLRSINTETVDLIATDPPFNKGRDFHATPESLASGASFQDRWTWKDDVHEPWIDQMQDDWPTVWAVIDWTRMTHSDSMAAFLCFMAVRLVAMYRILKPTGSIYLHCDPTASHYLKTLMDAVFGPKQFRSELVWKRTTAHNDHAGYGNNIDRILAYAKGDSPTFHTQYTAYGEKHLKRFKHADPDGRRFTDDNLTAKGLRGGGYEYEYKGCSSLWRVPLASMERLDREGRLYFTRTGGIRLKRYLDELPGRPVQSLWDDIDPINSQAQERTGYPTQKPLELYRRMIRASTNAGDVVLDPFCGCATTPIAAELEGRQWLGADLWDMAPKMVTDRLAKEVAVGEADQGDMLARKVVVRTEPLVRTDGGGVSAPLLPTLRRTADKPTMSRAKMIDALIEEHGMRCQGCGFEFPHKGFIELDHSIPRSEGGSNDIANRILLCPPCNRTKSNTLTLTGLRKANKKAGVMADQLALSA